MRAVVHSGDRQHLTRLVVEGLVALGIDLSIFQDPAHLLGGIDVVELEARIIRDGHNPFCGRGDVRFCLLSGAAFPSRQHGHEEKTSGQDMRRSR